MRIIILSGFLGSGKTTFLLQLADYMTKQKMGKKVVILENEIGENGIDDKLIKENGYTVNNLFSGCVCCTLAGELLEAVDDIEEKYNPDYLVIETTGLAYPGKMAENIRKYKKMNVKVIVVVDSFRWKRIHIPLQMLLKGQIESAQIVLLNKVDLCSVDIVETVKKDVRKMNETALQLEIQANYPILESNLEVILEGE